MNILSVSHMQGGALTHTSVIDLFPEVEYDDAKVKLRDLVQSRTIELVHQGRDFSVHQLYNNCDGGWEISTEEETWFFRHQREYSFVLAALKEMPLPMVLKMINDMGTPKLTEALIDEIKDTLYWNLDASVQGPTLESEPESDSILNDPNPV